MVDNNRILSKIFRISGVLDKIGTVGIHRSGWAATGLLAVSCSGPTVPSKPDVAAALRRTQARPQCAAHGAGWRTGGTGDREDQPVSGPAWTSALCTARRARSTGGAAFRGDGAESEDVAPRILGARPAGREPLRAGVDHAALGTKAVDSQIPIPDFRMCCSES